MLAVLLGGAPPIRAQTPATTSEPYAKIDRDAITYSGPGREASKDLPGPEIRIGMILPLRGPRKPEGDALLAAAQLALEDEAPTPLPRGLRLALATRDETGPWGRASSEIARLVFDDRALALITSADGRAAHLAEQVGNRVGVPVLTLASDSTTTQINIPWFFRLAPNDATQAQVFAHDIYHQRGLKKVLVVTARDHDGRVGADEFLTAARRLATPPPARLVIPSTPAQMDTFVTEITAQNPEAVVFWADAESTAKLLPDIRQTLPHAVPFYLCSKILQEPFWPAMGGSCRSCSKLAQGRDENIWVVAPQPIEAFSAQESFAQRFRARLGSAPNPAAAAAYDAVRLIAAALRETGPNRARLRDSLASRAAFPGVSGMISFDGAGNNQAEVMLVPLR